MKLNLNLKNEVAILFKKPDRARDGRPMSQMARVAIHKQFVANSPWTNSPVVQDGRVGPCELIKISDFLGFDQEAQRPGAAARVEQNLGLILSVCLGVGNLLIMDSAASINVLVQLQGLSRILGLILSVCLGVGNLTC